MRLAFVGKGGSGKTTLASLYAEFESDRGKNVLALDADINQHLAASLRCDEDLKGLGVELDDIKQHLRGSNTRFEATAMHKTTPPGTGSNFVTVRRDDWFISNYAKDAGGVLVAGAGEIPESNVGVRCYHSLNGAVELVLGHLLDADDDVVVVDMTAGADAFSSSLFAKVDAMVLVLEPTLKSLSVYDQFARHSARLGLRLFLVANKVQDDADRSFIEERVGPLTASIGHSALVRSRERGESSHDLRSDQHLQTELQKLANAIGTVSRDWTLLEQRSHDLHVRNANDWMGQECLDHIDPDFSLARHAASQGF